MISIANRFHLAVIAFSITLVSFIYTKQALGSLLSQTLMYPVIASLDPINPVCYMQKANGSTVDLSSLCGNYENKKPLSEIDQKFLESYKNSMSGFQETQFLVIRRTEKDSQSSIKIAQGVCKLLNGKVLLTDIQKNQYDTIMSYVNTRSQESVLIEAQIINALAPQFYCPNFAK